MREPFEAPGEPDDDALEEELTGAVWGRHETRVLPEWQGLRLDRALVLWQPSVSRSHLKQLVEDGALALDGEACRLPARKLRSGQKLALELRPPEAMLAFVPEPMALPIVHEDAELLVLDKPAGLVVHPAAGNWQGTLMNGLLAHHEAAATLPRAGIVHRLDKDTSGLMVVAKTLRAYERLVAQLAAREVRREYLALARGAWGEARRIDLPVGRDPRQRVRMGVVPEARGGKPAQTDVEALAQHPRASLLHCRLHTGRTHQIRVHCAAAGHPLFGDALYGGPALPGLNRQALHAARLTLAHPGSGAACQWTAEPPTDLLEAAKALDLPGPRMPPQGV
ncbi:MAG: RluA family pseudouridine synthase [Inhella sp.]|nr:RluA family pseudouridine synthase [Inhella sp.]